MSVSSLGSITMGSNVYNFKDMTSKQAIAAAGDLFQQGAITGDEFASLAGDTTALGFSPSGGGQAGSPDSLDSTVKSNYLDLLKNNISSLEGKTGGDAGLQKALANNNSLFQVLTAYQEKEDPLITSVSSGMMVNQQA